jgi:putative cardiolipin synthase
MITIHALQAPLAALARLQLGGLWRQAVIAALHGLRRRIDRPEASRGQLRSGAAADRLATPFGRAAQRAAAAAVVLAAALGAGCTSLPAAAPQAPGAALAASDDTPLARLVAGSTPPQARDLSGLQLMADGVDALAVRLALARHAQRSLDVQYYQIADDDAGRQFLRALHDAARRGVRVRLLLDDLHAAELWPLLRAIETPGRLEVRLFNPLPARSGTPAQRVLGSLHEFGRINRRMHNKLFIADNSLAVMGGRNIGDEYFMRATHANFIDMDVLATGGVVRELSASFDAFWNHRLAYGLGALGGPGGAASLPPAAPLPADHGVAAQIEQGRLALHFGRVQVLADAPTKADDTSAAGVPGDAMKRALELMQSAQTQVLIASPYFVPGRNGLALLQDAVQRGIAVKVLTNSLGATDEPLAHAGYARYRHEMLRMGVELAELSPLQNRAAGGSGPLRSALGRLHAKLAVVDGERLIVGSLNMDLRSSRLNTEIALAIESTELADAAAQLLNRHWQERHFRPRLNPQAGRIEWLEHDGQNMVRHAQEPHAGSLMQLRLGLLSLLVAEEHL